MTVQSFLLSLMVFLVISTAIEFVLPSGETAAYAKYFIGLVTVLFLLTLGSKFDWENMWGDVSFQASHEIGFAEQKVSDRVQALMEERIAADVLETFPECTSVSEVVINEEGAVGALEVVTVRFVSRSAIAERYGIPVERVTVRGVGET